MGLQANLDWISNMKKHLSLFCMSLLTTTIAYGGMEERIESLEREMQEISTRTPQDTFGAKFTSARPDVDGEKAFFTFDILYWHPKVGGTEFAYSYQPEIVSVPGGGVSVRPAKRGTIKENEFDWEWGLKVGLGYNVPHDEWDVYGNYTWYQPHSTESTSKAPPSGLAPLRQFGEIIAQKAKSHFDIAYHNVDIEVGRNYYISRFLSFRPFLSVKTSWIDLDERLIYAASPLNGVAFPGEFTTSGFDFKTHSSSDFWGIGPRIGVNSLWFLGYGFGLFADVASAIQYGYFKTVHKESFPPHVLANFNFDKNLIKVRSKFHRFVPYARLYAGLEWDGYVNHQKQHIRLKLGYEVQYYWRVNQIPQIEDTTATLISEPIRVQYERFSEDVMFYGVTGEFRLDF